MKTKKMFGNVMFMLLLFLLFPLFCAGLGVSPNKVIFEEVLPGGYGEASVLLSNPKDIPVFVDVNVKGPVSDWVEIIIENSSLAARGITQMIIIVKPPIDAEEGEYEVEILLNNVPEGVISGMGNKLALTMSLPLLFSITDARQSSCVLGGFQVSVFEQGDSLRALYSVKNTGNTRITPNGVLSISDEKDVEIYTMTINEEEATSPTLSKEYSVIGSSLDTGNYEAKLVLETCGEESHVFTVLEPGALGEEGTFIELEPPSETEPLIAEFLNTGQRSVVARFSGVILQDGEIIQVVETEKLFVAPGESVNLESYLDLPAGSYEVKGAIHYENKRTEERVIELVIDSEKIYDPSITIASILLVLIIIGIILIANIRKKK